MTMFELSTLSTLFTIIHLFGVVAGGGGALMSDVIFFLSIKDKRLSKTEIYLLQQGSKLIWTGITLLFISGAGLFFTNIDKYIESSKFILKMFIVICILINGVLFHTLHIPFLKKRENIYFRDIPELAQKRIYLLISGVISIISWSLALILGSLKSIPLTVTEGIISYVIITGLGIITSYILRDNIIPLS